MKFLSKFIDLPYVSGFSCKKVQLNLASSLIIESGKQTWDFKPIQDGVKKSPPPPPPPHHFLEPKLFFHVKSENIFFFCKIITNE